MNRHTAKNESAINRVTLKVNCTRLLDAIALLPTEFHSFQAELTVVTLTHLLLHSLQVRLFLAQIVTTLTHLLLHSLQVRLLLAQIVTTLIYLLLQELQARLLLTRIGTTLAHFPLPHWGQ